jgi:putative peptide zinc metalloprotease protein
MPDTPFFSESWFRVAGIRASLRPDLRADRQRFRGRSWYVVHDAVSLTNHRLTPEAWFFLARLDGQRTVDAVWREIVAELGDSAPGQDEIVELLGRLFAADLIRTDRNPGIDGLLTRRRKQHKSLWIKNLANPLSIRIPLWDCDAFLTRHAPVLRPFLGLYGWLGWLLWVLPAMWFALQHHVELTANLSDRLLAPDNLLILLLAFPLVKFVHELAHGAVLKVNGGVAHEMGIMFLVLAPIPYVDASAASAIRSKWTRAFVGIAGMWAELALAAAAMYLWLLLEPGAVRSVMHSVILIAGISTVIFNANPLLRFDGYYVLCDLLEMPNLGGRSNAYWLELIRRLMLGEKPDRAKDYTPRERAWLRMYAPLALMYRLSVTFAIVLFVAQEYFFVGVILAIVALVGSIVIPCVRGVLFVVSHSSLARIRRRAVGGLVAAIGGSMLFFLLVPVPLWVTAEGLLWVPPCAEIRAPESGFVSGVLQQDKQMVAAGTPVLELESIELQATLEAQRARTRQMDIQFQSERTRDRTKAAISKEELDAELRALHRTEERMANLQVSSCVTGEIQLHRSGDLPGRFVERGELLGFVRTHSQSIVRVVVPQDDVGLVRRSSPEVRVMISDQTGRELRGNFLRHVPGGEFALPAAALGVGGGGIHATDPSDNEHLRTINRVFQLDVELPSPVTGSRVGARAYVKFSAPAEPIAKQLARRVRQLFLSRLDV